MTFVNKIKNFGSKILKFFRVLLYIIVSKDIKSLYWLKESFQWLIGDIWFVLRDTWHKIYDEKFDAYKHIK